MAISDAVCIPAKCGKTKKSFNMLYYKAYDEKWVLTYGREEFPTHSAQNSGRTVVKLKSVRTGPQYKCPHCGKKYAFTCWNCGERTCYDGDNHDGREVICAHCGKSGVFTSNKSESSNPKDIYGYGMSGQ